MATIIVTKHGSGTPPLASLEIGELAVDPVTGHLHTSPDGVELTTVGGHWDATDGGINYVGGSVGVNVDDPQQAFVVEGGSFIGIEGSAGILTGNLGGTAFHISQANAASDSPQVPYQILAKTILFNAEDSITLATDTTINADTTINGDLIVEGSVFIGAEGLAGIDTLQFAGIGLHIARDSEDAGGTLVNYQVQAENISLNANTEITLETDTIIRGNLRVTDFFGIGSIANLVLEDGVMNAESSHIALDTEGDAATDDLDTINGGLNGHIIILRATNSTHNIVAKDGTGNLRLAGDFTMTSIRDRLMLIFVGDVWSEISRSTNGA